MVTAKKVAAKRAARSKKPNPGTARARLEGESAAVASAALAVEKAAQAVERAAAATERAAAAADKVAAAVAAIADAVARQQASQTGNSSSYRSTVPTVLPGDPTTWPLADAVLDESGQLIAVKFQGVDEPPTPLAYFLENDGRLQLVMKFGGGLQPNLAAKFAALANFLKRSDASVRLVSALAQCPTGDCP